MKQKFFAFTLAEIMIVLTVVGVLTAVLLPAAFHAAPDENIMKFKKANSTLGTVIRELVNSDEYYLEGDLAYRADGTRIDGTHEGDYSYFCESFADMVSTKSVNCRNTAPEEINGENTWIYTFDRSEETDYRSADSKCDTASKKITKAEIVTSDGISFYLGNNVPFGVTGWDSGASILDDAFHNSWGNSNGFYGLALLFCLDVDGINSGEAPFGYGIRVDGKIIPGLRALEWIEKSVQKGE